MAEEKPKTKITFLGCANCKFFLENEDDSEARAGLCRRYPPTYSPFSDVGEFPAIWAETVWCGEYEIG